MAPWGVRGPRPSRAPTSPQAGAPRPRPSRTSTSAIHRVRFAQRSRTGQQIVLAQVHNTGGRALDLSGDLKLTNSSGSLTAGPFKAQTGTPLAPGGSGPVAVLLDEQLPAGPWRARIRLQSGLTKRAAEATITFPLAGTAQSIKAETDLSYYPIAALVIGVVLSALMTLKVVLLQRKRRIRPRTSR